MALNRKSIRAIATDLDTIAKNNDDIPLIYKNLVSKYSEEDIQKFFAGLVHDQSLDQHWSTGTKLWAEDFIKTLSEAERAAFKWDNGTPITGKVKTNAAVLDALISESNQRTAEPEQTQGGSEQVGEPGSNIIGIITYYDNNETVEYTDPDAYLQDIQKAIDDIGINGWKYETVAEDATLKVSINNILYDAFGESDEQERAQEGAEQADETETEFSNEQSDAPEELDLDDSGFSGFFSELQEMYERCNDYENELDGLRDELQNYKEGQNQPGSVVDAAYAIEEKIRALTQMLEELKRRIQELLQELKSGVKEKTEKAIDAVKGEISGIRADMENMKTDIGIVKNQIADKVKAAFTKTPTEAVLNIVKKGDLVAFHQMINAETEDLPRIFAAALARNDRIGNAMTEQVLEELGKREIEGLTDVERSSDNNVRAAMSRVFARLEPTKVLKGLIEDKKTIAAEKLLGDKRMPHFLRSEQGGDALYAALQAKNMVIAKGIAAHLSVPAFNRAMRLSLNNLDAKAAGNMIRLGANTELFIKITAWEDKNNPFLTDKQRKFMNDITKFWNSERTRSEPQIEQEQGMEHGE